MEEERKKICEKCEHSAGWYCKQCYCIIPIKVVLKNEKCPLGKW